MAVYFIANVKVTDPAWVPDYAANVHEIVHKHGGKYLSRSGAITPFEGEAPDLSLVAVLEFPSMDAVQAFIDDPDYYPYREARRAGSVGQVYAIDDTDVAGTIPYLGRG